MDIRKERVIKEVEQKAQHIALQWFKKNYEKVYKNPQLTPEQIPKNAAKLYEEICLSRKRMVQRQKEEEAKDAQLRRPPKKEQTVKHYSKEFLLRGPMYPVNEEQRKLIYTGVSHNDEGRRAYLKVRSDVRPDKKYYDPPTSTMDYGWQVEERCWRPNKQFVHIYVVKKSFYRRNGALEVGHLKRRIPFSAAQNTLEIL